VQLRRSSGGIAATERKNQVTEKHPVDMRAVPTLSFVLPALDETANIQPITRRIMDAAEPLDAGFEIIWVNDGSSDGTEQEIERIAASDPRVRALHLSRQFGQMAALTAGLEAAHATGAVITMDADGQHPPELIPELVARWRDGADIVQAVRAPNPDEPPLKRMTSDLFYFVLNRLAGTELPAGAADFRLLDRQAVDALNSLPERVRFLRGLVHWIGYRVEMVTYTAPGRLAGKTKYTFGRMLALALGGITSFAVRPLRLAFMLGVLVLLFAFVYAAYVLTVYATGGQLVAGWPSLLLTVLLLGGIQLLTLGIASEYLARIYEETKGRPVYLLRKPRKAPRE
jgi:dolichol-phosphate mannosyltransferase